MLSAVTPISFQANPLNISRKFISQEGKELALNIKALSNAEKAYSLEVNVLEGEFLRDYYSSGSPKGFIKTVADFAAEAYDGIKHTAVILNRWGFEDKDSIMEPLARFFGEASEKV